VALEAAERFLARFALGLFASEVDGAVGVHLPLLTARRCSAQLTWPSE
jgi:hypothetical protein